MGEYSNSAFKVMVSDRVELSVCIKDLLGAPVEAVVNPANSGLSHGAGLAAIISNEAGPELDERCNQIIKKIGKIQVTQAVPTSAFQLPYKGIIHAVGPRMGDGDEQIKLEKTIYNCLYLTDRKAWRSVAFPAMGTGIFGIPFKYCAQAFKNAIWKYFLDTPESGIERIWICLTIDTFGTFRDVFCSR